MSIRDKTDQELHARLSSIVEEIASSEFIESFSEYRRTREGLKMEEATIIAELKRRRPL